MAEKTYSILFTQMQNLAWNYLKSLVRTLWGPIIHRHTLGPPQNRYRRTLGGTLTILGGIWTFFWRTIVVKIVQMVTSRHGTSFAFVLPPNICTHLLSYHW